MKVLMLSKEGDGLGVAHRLVKEGHEVVVWIKDRKYSSALKGIVRNVSSWRQYIPWADFVIADMVGFGHLEGLFRKRGVHAFSVQPFADAVELDRQRGHELFVRAGIKTPRTWNYNSPSEALASPDWPREEGVLKPGGNIDTGKTYIYHDPDTAEWALRGYNKDVPIMIQEYIQGIEISTEGWFNGRGFLFPFNHTFEEKRFFPGGLSRNVGCMGNLVFTTKGDKIVQETVQRLEPVLKKASYKGPIDINAIVNEDGIYAIEPSCRLGYDAIEALMEGLREPMLDLLFEVATGAKTKMDVIPNYLIAVRLSVPPWPMGDVEDKEAGLPIVGIDEENLKHIYFTDVSKSKGGYIWSGSDGVLLKATAWGQDINEARRRVYRTLGNLEILNKQYRMDIGQRAISEIQQLKEWGYL